MMIRRSPGRRPGLSLMEVLIGFGLMGIAIPALITFFPFGAITLGQANKDDRASTCAVTADGLLRDIHTRNVVELNGGGEPYFDALDYTPPQNGQLPNGQPSPPLPPPQPNEPSCPVVIDPMGYYARRDTLGIPFNLGDNGAAQLPRVSLSMIENYAFTSPTTNRATVALRLCSQMDGLSYNEDGAVENSPATMRELRYNWMWVVQRPVNRDRFTVRMQVVVYDKRAHLYNPVRSEAVFNPVVINPGSPTGTRTGVTFTPGETSILNVPASAELRKGSWVMDATLLDQSDPTQNAKADGDGVARTLRHAEFYRVLSVSEAANGTQSLEVHRPISRPDGQYSASNPLAFRYVGTLVSMPAVTDVFERNQMTAAAGP